MPARASGGQRLERLERHQHRRSPEHWGVDAADLTSTMQSKRYQQSIGRGIRGHVKSGTAPIPSRFDQSSFANQTKALMMALVVAEPVGDAPGILS